MQKRKAAADIFKEQNIMIQEESLEPSIQLPAPPLAMDMEYVKGRVASSPPDLKPMVAMPQPKIQKQLFFGGLKSSEELQLEKEPIPVRETGFWFWRRVIVPPNAYVVHTRMGRKEAVTIGLGLSFGYNSYTDAYLVVPAAMQTIGVVANCISKEKQGINILAYVQWQIDDFSIAYRKLDFSDSRDPLGIVNAQLREQAEAAIKDKISTMSVEEVLTDKAPIIEELTARLKGVAEGRRQGEVTETTGEGLGIKIVTVQIREALVSSQTLWQDLQAPFRHQQEKTARISYLLTQDEIRQTELETRQTTETSEAETMVAIERIKQSKQTEAVDLKLTEESIRFSKEQEATRQKIQLEEETTVIRRESEQRLQTQVAKIEHARQLELWQRQHEQTLTQTKLEAESNNRQKSGQIEQALHAITEENRLAEAKMKAEQQRLEQALSLQQQESEVKLGQQEQEDLLEEQILKARLARQQQEHTTQLELEESSNRVKIAMLEKEVGLIRAQQEIRNLIGTGDLQSRFIDKLPELAAEMPEIHELKVFQTSQGDATFDALATFMSKMLVLAESLGISLPVGHKKSEPV